jgi:hypothetical protein
MLCYLFQPPRVGKRYTDQEPRSPVAEASNLGQNKHRQQHLTWVIHPVELEVKMHVYPSTCTSVDLNLPDESSEG